MIRSGSARQGSHFASEKGNKPSLPVYDIHEIVESRARKNRMRILPYVIVAAGLGGAAPGLYFDEWGWERRNWLWD
jgi:hypothetical protein